MPSSALNRDAGFAVLGRDNNRLRGVARLWGTPIRRRRRSLRNRRLQLLTASAQDLQLDRVVRGA